MQRTAAEPDTETSRRSGEWVTGSISATTLRRATMMDWSGVSAWYNEVNAAMPMGQHLAYCSGFGCSHRTLIAMTPDRQAALDDFFNPEIASAEDERVAIERAVAWFEQQAIPLMNHVVDVNGTDAHHDKMLGQTDCIDEAANTTTFLIYLQRSGRLRHHTVARPVARGGLWVPHVTAVLRDQQTGVRWAIDSWARNGGEPPVVLTLARWDEWMGTGR
jgi:hypothetical protein